MMSVMSITPCPIRGWLCMSLISDLKSDLRAANKQIFGMSLPGDGKSLLTVMACIHYSQAHGKAYLSYC